MQLAMLRQQTELKGFSDEELVGLARQGGENAVRALIKRNNQRLFRVARAVVRNDGEAEDIVQETYVRAFTKSGVISRRFPVHDLAYPHRSQRSAWAGAAAEARCRTHRT